MKLIGPFVQIITLRDVPVRGPLVDDALEIIPDGGILVEGDRIVAVGNFEFLYYEHEPDDVEDIDVPAVAFPGFIDCHTHACFAGTRVDDFARWIGGASMEEVVQAGGGLQATVFDTRHQGLLHLARDLEARLSDQLYHGITTTEVKSGYGLDVDTELRMLRVISELNRESVWDVVPTCYAAQAVPLGYESPRAYCSFLLEELLPRLRDEQLTNRFDITVDERIFDVETARWFLNVIKAEGYDLTVHAEQFGAGGADLAVELNARSADDLTMLKTGALERLAKSETIPVVLPGSSLGTGRPFAPARRLLDAGGSLAIASNWNPHTAPMGNLTAQAGILAAYERLSCAEVLAGITVRAAAALNLNDRAQLAPDFRADLVCYVTEDWRELIYRQGGLGDAWMVWKDGERVV